MVSTRRAAAAAAPAQAVADRVSAAPSQPQDSATPKQQRAVTRRKTAPSSTQPATTKRQRRLRSDKKPDSPLQALKSPPKRKKTKTASPTPDPSHAIGQTADPGEGIFFSETPISLPIPKKETKDTIIKQLRARIVELENQVRSLDQVHVVELEDQVKVLENHVKELNSHVTGLNDHLDIINSKLADAQYETDQIRKENLQLQQQIVQARSPLQAASEPEPTHSPIIHIGAVEGTASSLALLQQIEDNAKPTPVPKALSQASPTPDGVEKSLPDLVEVSAPVTPAPAVQSTKSTPFAFFSKAVAYITSPFTASPFTSNHIASSPAPAQQSTSSSQSNLNAALTPTTTPVGRPSASSHSELTMALTPTPTPVGESRNQSRNKRSRSKSRRQMMIKAVEDSVNGAEEKKKAAAWAHEVLAKLPNNSSMLGEKRKRLEKGVKVGDLKKIQGTKPWNTGSYGLDDDLMDLSDSDDAPAWAVVYDLICEENEENQPPTKKRKPAHEPDMDDIVSLNDTVVPTSTEFASSNIFNSNGHSASLQDLRPRSAITPSPMFDAPKAHKHDGNVFSELEDQTLGQQSQAEERAARKRELQRTGHIAGSGSFCVPEGDSDEEESTDEDTVNEQSGSSLWTQQPPPAPVPAHASLPTPLAESLPESPVADKTMDPIELQRAKITKHTPAKPSRLREMQVLSPSVKSDAGNESMVADSPLKIAAPVVFNFHPLEMPDAQPIPVETAEQQAFIDNYILSEEFKVNTGDNCGWADPIIDEGFYDKYENLEETHVDIW